MRPSSRVAILLLVPFFFVPAARGAGQSPAQIRGEITAAHNRVRSNHGLSSLSWSGRLAGIAQDWADHLANDNGCRMRHRSNNSYGENLYWASAMRFSSGKRQVMSVSPSRVVNSWASEKKYYDADSNRCERGRVCGHYTQVVWHSTRQVGCAMTVCPDKGQIWVCNYHPAGNIIGQRPFDPGSNRVADDDTGSEPQSQPQSQRQSQPSHRHSNTFFGTTMLPSLGGASIPAINRDSNRRRNQEDVQPRNRRRQDRISNSVTNNGRFRIDRNPFPSTFLPSTLKQQRNNRRIQMQKERANVRKERIQMKKERIQMKKERANVRKERTRRRVLDLMNNPPRNRSGQGRDNRENELLRGVLGIMQYHR